MSLFLRASGAYKKSVSSYPYIVQGVQSSILMATGDAIAQKLVEGKEEFDYKRLLIKLRSIVEKY